MTKLVLMTAVLSVALAIRVPSPPVPEASGAAKDDQHARKVKSVAISQEAGVRSILGSSSPGSVVLVAGLPPRQPSNLLTDILNALSPPRPPARVVLLRPPNHPLRGLKQRPLAPYGNPSAPGRVVGRPLHPSFGRSNYLNQVLNRYNSNPTNVPAVADTVSSTPAPIIVTSTPLPVSVSSTPYSASVTVNPTESPVVISTPRPSSVTINPTQHPSITTPTPNLHYSTVKPASPTDIPANLYNLGAIPSNQQYLTSGLTNPTIVPFNPQYLAAILANLNQQVVPANPTAISANPQNLAALFANPAALSVNPTQYPTTPTQYPATPTQYPAAVPVNPTQYPTTPTQYPATPTQYPAAVPVNPTQYPTTPTQYPATPTQYPAAVPVNPTQYPSAIPASPTQYSGSVHVNPTQYRTAVPQHSTEDPVDSTEDDSSFSANPMRYPASLSPLECPNYPFCPIPSAPQDNNHLQTVEGSTSGSPYTGASQNTYSSNLASQTLSVIPLQGIFAAAQHLNNIDVKPVKEIEDSQDFGRNNAHRGSTVAPPTHLSALRSVSSTATSPTFVGSNSGFTGSYHNSLHGTQTKYPVGVDPAKCPNYPFC